MYTPRIYIPWKRRQLGDNTQYIKEAWFSCPLVVMFSALLCPVCMTTNCFSRPSITLFHYHALWRPKNTLDIFALSVYLCIGGPGPGKRQLGSESLINNAPEVLLQLDISDTFNVLDTCTYCIRTDRMQPPFPSSIRKKEKN